MDLTDDGKIVFRSACKIFELERDLELAIDDLRKMKQGHLRIGTTRTYARYLMPFLLVPFHRSFPGITIELNEGTPLEMSESLLDFRNSLAIITKVEENPDINFIPFMQEGIVLIVAANSHLAKRDGISIEELAGEPVIMMETGSATRKLVEGCFREAKQNLNIIAETGSVEFIKELVKQGEGVSFLLRTAVHRELTEGSLASIHIRNQKLLFNVCICHLRGYELPLPAKAFLDFVQSVIQKRKPFPGIDSLMAAISSRKR